MSFSSGVYQNALQGNCRNQPILSARAHSWRTTWNVTWNLSLCSIHRFQLILKSSMRSGIGGRAEISGGKRQDITYSCVVTLGNSIYVFGRYVKDVKALEKMFFWNHGPYFPTYCPSKIIHCFDPLELANLTAPSLIIHCFDPLDLKLD